MEFYLYNEVYCRHAGKSLEFLLYFLSRKKSERQMFIHKKYSTNDSRPTNPIYSHKPSHSSLPNVHSKAH